VTISEEQRRTVVSLYLAGATYREIANQTNVSTGTISQLITEETKRVPDIKTLRSTVNLWRKKDLTILDVMRYLALSNEVNRLNLTWSDVENATNLLKRYGDDASAVVEQANLLGKLEEQHGIPFTQAVNRYTQTNQALQDSQAQLEETRRKIREAESRLLHLDELEKLQRIIDEKKITHMRLEEIIDDQEALHKCGFTRYHAEIIQQELNKINSNPAAAANTLAHNLVENLTLADENLRIRRENESLTNTQHNLNIAINSNINLIQEQEKILIRKKELVKDYDTHITDLQFYLENGKEEKEKLDEAMKILRKELSLYNDALNKNVPISLIAALLTDPKTVIDPKSLATTLHKLFVSLDKHWTVYPPHSYNVDTLRRTMKIILALTAREWIDANKPNN